MSNTLLHEPPAFDSSELRLSRLIGSGGHGAVFLARLLPRNDHTRALDVAVKIPMGTGPNSEAETLRRFAHPHIIELIGCRDKDGALCLELLTGGTLEQRIETDGLNPNEVKTVGDALVNALRVIHSEHWVHGDVSPSNIGFRGDGTPVLFDFALAQPASNTVLPQLNADFAGPHHHATTLRDIRCLAETMRRAAATNDAKQGLVNFVQLCDQSIGSESPPVLQELTALWSGFEDDSSNRALPRVPTGGPPRRGQTKPFGPSRPTESRSGEEAAGAPRPLGVVFGFILLALTGWIAALIVTTPNTDSTPPSGTPEQLVLETARTIAASESLDAHQATWHSSRGVLSIATDAEPRRLLVGKPGDQAAIADWNCDGLATLGLYRTVTGEFFWFDSWDDEAISHSHEQVDPPERDLLKPTLELALDRNDCAEPIIR